MNRSKALDAVRAVLLVVVLGAVVIALWRNWEAVSTELRRLDARVVAVAFVIGIAPPIFTMFAWRVLLHDLGTHLALPPAASIFFVGQLGKYVPGSVWTVVMQTEMGARLNVPRRRMAMTGLVMLFLSVLGGAVVALPALPRLLTQSMSGFSPWWGVAGVALVLTVLYPPVLNSLITRALRLVRREPLEHDLSAGAIIRSMLLIFGAWISTGLSVLVVAAHLAPDADLTSLALVCICGFALASVLGMVSFLLPAGVGVREAVLLLLLTVLMPASAATAVVVLVRFLNVVTDVLFAGVGWLWARTHHLLPDRKPTQPNT